MIYNMAINVFGVDGRGKKTSTLGINNSGIKKLGDHVARVTVSIKVLFEVPLMFIIE